MELTHIALYLAIGLVGGAFGAMVGIAGATFIVPMAALLLAPDTQELRCATMLSNVAVSLGAIRPYAVAGNINWHAAARLAPAAVVAVIVGIWLSFDIDAITYRGIFGAFLLAVVLRELIKLLQRDPGERPPRPVTMPVALAAGTGAGLASGVLSVGGGIVMVPVLREALHFPIKLATGTSIATVLPIVAVGAVVWVWKLAALPASADGHAPLAGALKIAACLVPAALVGGWIGAKLNGVWPKRRVQWTVAIGLFLASVLLIHPFIQRFFSA